MSTATRGTVLAGRYRLEERLQSNADGALWRGIDSTLDRRVSIRVMRPGHPFAADVADAARRAALVDDSRLVRVLDVGSDGEIGFVVSEHVDGDSLAVLVERSPLAPPVVRRIIGEVAEGLQGAAVRGLHHLCLTPRSVLVCRDGSVKIIGTAVEAAATGLEPAHAGTASRDDAVALVGLLYSGLTGRWPLGNAGFPPAPRGEGGGPVPPADLVRGIPNDLDTLCAVTLGGQDDGPRSPAELAKELAPWPSAEEAPLRAAPRRLPTDSPPAPVGPDSPLKIRSRPATKRSAAAKSAKSAKSATPPVPAAGKSESGLGATGIAAAGATAAAGAGAPRRSASLFPTPSVAATGSLPIPKEPTGSGPRRMDSLFTQQTVYPGSATPATSTPTEPASPTDNLAPAESTRPAPAAPAHGDTAPGSTIKTTPPTKPAKPARPAKPAKGKKSPAPTPEPAGAGTTIGGRPIGAGPAAEPVLPWSPAWSKGGSGPGPATDTGPFPIVIPAETPPREQSRLVIFSITVVLVLGLVVAAFSLRDIGSNSEVEPTDAGLGTAQATPAATPTVEATTPAAAETAPVTQSPTPSPTEAVPVAIAAIRAIDPQGDGDEDTADTPLAVDGDDTTNWHSQTYRSSAFGGLKKGVGLSIKLKQSATLTSATLDVSGTGGAFEVRTAKSPDLDSSKVVGKGTIDNGRVTVETKGAKPSRYVILWFTKLPSVGGSYKVEVSEVRLK